MEYSVQALNVLTVKTYPGVSTAWIVQNIQGGETTDEIVSRLAVTGVVRVKRSEFEQRREQYESVLVNRMKQHCDGIVARGDALFPAIRGVANAEEIPVFLYYQGDITLLQKKKKSVAVVGVRMPTGEVEKREREIVRDLVEAGVVVISGLADGCDSIAHRQTIVSRGKTVAILPSALSKILPESNVQLADLIVSNGGLLLTEYSQVHITREELIGRYIARDRLQALFSDAVVLTASYAKDSNLRSKQLRDAKLDSGSRYAMNAAIRYKVPRVVMYDAQRDAADSMFDLNRDLITQGLDIHVLSGGDTQQVLHKIYI